MVQCDCVYCWFAISQNIQKQKIPHAQTVAARGERPNADCVYFYRRTY